MKPLSIHLGYEIGTGKQVEIPLRHMAVTGMTQESGKTTTLEALAMRSGRKMLAFLTKRGERGFAGATYQIAPFFQERADWEFVESILESMLHQRMKFERAWVVRACKSAKTLSDVQANVSRLSSAAKRGMDQDMYMLLDEYLNKVVPLIKRLPKTDAIDLHPGLNVVNLLDYPEELQMLVVSSTLRWIHAHAEDVVTIIPEAWKFVPQGRKTPVKLEVEKLAREGAGIKNYIWIDSQDMAGVEKLVLRAASVWIIGVQRELNELKRALGNIPAGIKRPKPEDVAQLGLGEFYACWHDNTLKVYVQPEWVSNEDARAVSLGLMSASDLSPQRVPPRPMSTPIPAPAPIVQPIKIEMPKEIPMKDQTNIDLEARRRELLAELETIESQMKTPKVSTTVNTPSNPDLEAIYAYVRERLVHDPKVIRLVVSQPEIEIEIERESIAMTNKTLVGRLAQMIAEGFFDKPQKGQHAFDELWGRLQFPQAKSKPNVYRELDKLAQMGFLTKESDGYQVVPSMKKNIVKAEK